MRYTILVGGLQDFNLIALLAAVENSEYGPVPDRVPKAKRNRRVRGLRDTPRLGNFSHHQTELSNARRHPSRALAEILL